MNLEVTECKITHEGYIYYAHKYKGKWSMRRQEEDKPKIPPYMYVLSELNGWIHSLKFEDNKIRYFPDLHSLTREIAGNE